MNKVLKASVWQIGMFGIKIAENRNFDKLLKQN